MMYQQISDQPARQPTQMEVLAELYAKDPSVRRATNELRARLAAADFAAFRRFMRPTMLWGWFVQDVAEELQQFYNGLKAGKRPKLAIEAPPQHGKSLAAKDFCAWLAGKEPDWRTIFASYSEGLGVAANREVARLMISERYNEVFPQVGIGADGWSVNTDLIEYPGFQGSFRNTTVKGSINGFGLHFGLIDDPVKGSREARQKTERDETWRWFTDDFFGRFADNAGFLAIMTRWHVDDVVGRMIERFGRWSLDNPDGIKVLRYPALAERDSQFRKKGQPLFPRHKSLTWLLERRQLLTQGAWEAEYQQNPIIVGGGALPTDRMRVIPVFDRTKIISSVRYWDKAGTDDSDDAAYTAGVLMHKMREHDPVYVIEHVVHGRWRAFDREAKIKQTAQNDRAVLGNYEIVVEQEPGSGGKESAENTVRNLAGFRVFVDRVTGDKVERAQPFAAQVQGHNVGVVAGDWVQGFFDECEPWPFGPRKDRVDAAAGAFNRLLLAMSYNTDYKQWAY